VLEEGLTPVIYDIGELQRFRHCTSATQPRLGQGEAASGLPQRWPVHVKIDTGMNRLGIQPAALPAFFDMADRYRHLEFDRAVHALRLG